MYAKVLMVQAIGQHAQAQHHLKCAGGADLSGGCPALTWQVNLKGKYLGQAREINFLLANVELKASVKKQGACGGCPTKILSANIWALIIRIGCWGPLSYNYNEEPPKPYPNY